MNCGLFFHLEQQRRLAAMRQEFAEVKRLDSEIAEHCDKCSACAVSAESLLEQLFGCAVIVTPASQIALLADKLAVKR